MIQTTMLKILVTVWVAGHPVQELLHKEYPTTTEACGKATKYIIDHAKKGVKARAECVPARTRGA